MVKPVYLYADEGTSAVGVKSLQQAVPQKLARPVKLIDAAELIANGLPNGCALIMPGGADLPYCAKLNGQGNARIREFVASGGFYLGICAGAYYACQQLAFTGAEYSVSGERELALFDGVAVGSLPDLTEQRYFDTKTHSKAMTAIHFTNQACERLYYHGGPMFVPAPSADFQPIAYYADHSDKPSERLAVVAGTFGNGRYLLSGVHFELQQAVYFDEVLAKAAAPEEQQREALIHAQLNPPYGARIWAQIRTILDDNI